MRRESTAKTEVQGCPEYEWRRSDDSRRIIRLLAQTHDLPHHQPEGTTAVRQHAARNLRGCLDCGKEFAYDWQKMRITALRKEDVYAAAQVEAKAS